MSKALLSLYEKYKIMKTSSFPKLSKCQWLCNFPFVSCVPMKLCGMYWTAATPHNWFVYLSPYCVSILSRKSFCFSYTQTMCNYARRLLCDYARTQFATTQTAKFFKQILFIDNNPKMDAVEKITFSKTFVFFQTQMKYAILYIHSI